MWSFSSATQFQHWPRQSVLRRCQPVVHNPPHDPVHQPLPVTAPLSPPSRSQLCPWCCELHRGSSLPPIKENILTCIPFTRVDANISDHSHLKVVWMSGHNAVSALITNGYRAKTNERAFTNCILPASPPPQQSTMYTYTNNAMMTAQHTFAIPPNLKHTSHKQVYPPGIICVTQYPFCPKHTQTYTTSEACVAVSSAKYTRCRPSLAQAPPPPHPITHRAKSPPPQHTQLHIYQTYVVVFSANCVRHRPNYPQPPNTFTHTQSCTPSHPPNPHT